MTQKLHLKEIFSQYAPPPLIPYLIQVWEESPFSLIITHPHRTSFGYYRYHPKRGGLIRLNSDLSTSHFTMTFLHEVAHHRVTIGSRQMKRRVAPHGPEWKKAFQDLMAPILACAVFPQPIQNAVQIHMLNPPASTIRDKRLTQLFRQEKGEIKQILADIPVGQEFVFQGRRFKLLAHRRTRSLCEDLHLKQKCLISQLAPI